MTGNCKYLFLYCQNKLKNRFYALTSPKQILMWLSKIKETEKMPDLNPAGSGYPNAEQVKALYKDCTPKEAREELQRPEFKKPTESMDETDYQINVIDNLNQVIQNAINQYKNRSFKTFG